MTKNKYVVVKAEHVTRRTRGWDKVVLMANEYDVIDDCVVIRFQDVFAGPALHEYAGQIRTALEIMRHMRLSEMPFGPTMRKLEELADFFAQAADAADRYRMKKVPD